MTEYLTLTPEQRGWVPVSKRPLRFQKEGVCVHNFRPEGSPSPEDVAQFEYATWQEIRKAFVVLRRKEHPEWANTDQNGGRYPNTA